MDSKEGSNLVYLLIGALVINAAAVAILSFAYEQQQVAAPALSPLDGLTFTPITSIALRVLVGTFIGLLLALSVALYRQYRVPATAPLMQSANQSPSIMMRPVNPQQATPPTMQRPMAPQGYSQPSVQPMQRPITPPAMQPRPAPTQPPVQPTLQQPRQQQRPPISGKPLTYEELRRQLDKKYRGL